MHPDSILSVLKCENFLKSGNNSNLAAPDITFLPLGSSVFSLIRDCFRGAMRMRT